MKCQHLVKTFLLKLLVNRGTGIAKCSSKNPIRIRNKTRVDLRHTESNFYFKKIIMLMAYLKTDQRNLLLFFCHVVVCTQNPQWRESRGHQEVFWLTVRQIHMWGLADMWLKSWGCRGYCLGSESSYSACYLKLSQPIKPNVFRSLPIVIC